MQYVGQTGRALQNRFSKHYHIMKKPKLIDTFLYQHFKLSGHSPNDVLVQPVEILTYDINSSSRFKVIKRHGTELKWIKLLQTPFPLGFNDNIYHEGNTCVLGPNREAVGPFGTNDCKLSFKAGF